MDVPRKCDTRNRLSAGRNKNRRTFRATDQTDRNSVSGADQGENGVHQLTFAEDFMMEHSFTSLRFSVVGIKGGSRTARKQPEPQPSAQYFGFPS